VEQIVIAAHRDL